MSESIMILRFWSVSRWGGIGFGLRLRSGQELRPTQHGTDNERSLEQVVKLCTTLGGNGFTFSICVKIHDVFDFELESTKPQNQYVKQKRRRSPSYYKSQAKRTLLKKKSNMAVSQDRYESCSLDISPNTDKAKLGLREISEAESKSDSRWSKSDNDTSALPEAEWEKMWSRVSAHLQPFFRLLASSLTIFDKKYCILTCCDKRESNLVLL